MDDVIGNTIYQGYVRGLPLALTYPFCGAAAMAAAAHSQRVYLSYEFLTFLWDCQCLDLDNRDWHHCALLGIARVLWRARAIDLDARDDDRRRIDPG